MAERPFYETQYKSVTPPSDESVQIIDKSDDAPCEKCGHFVEVGDYPFCKGNQADHGQTKHYGFEPYVDEHISPNGADVGYNYQGQKVRGTFIASRSDRQQIMKQNGLVSGGWGSNKHRSNRNRNTNFDQLADRAVNEATQEWSRRR